MACMKNDWCYHVTMEHFLKIEVLIKLPVVAEAGLW